MSIRIVKIAISTASEPTGKKYDFRPLGQPVGAALSVVKYNRISMSLVYHVDSVEKAGPPPGCQGQGWYRYVLKNHRSTINGYRRGSRQFVCDYAAQYAEQLNARTVVGSSRWSMNNKQPGPRA